MHTSEHITTPSTSSEKLWYPSNLAVIRRVGMGGAYMHSPHDIGSYTQGKQFDRKVRRERFARINTTDGITHPLPYFVNE